MAIELHHLHPGHDDELTRLKARIAELERMDSEHTLHIAKMNGYIHHLEEERRWFVERIDAIVIMTRDIGYHTSGWWKNPDYERCFHVSISYPGGTNKKKDRMAFKIPFRFRSKDDVVRAAVFQNWQKP